MSIYDHQISRLDGGPLDLHDYEDKALLIVNVASKCGLTPQYEGLEKLHEQYTDKGFSVLGVPCNQFLGQEPGTAEEIATFCSTTYGVTFPLAEKVEVNGDGRHPLYAELTDVGRRGGQRGRCVLELREVPRCAGRRGDAVPSAGRARGRRPRRRDRGRAARPDAIPPASRMRAARGPAGNLVRTAMDDDDPTTDHVRRPRCLRTPRQGPRRPGHRAAVRHPGAHDRRRPGRARRVRQGQDRLGQDARVRAPAPRAPGPCRAPQAPRPRARPDPRARAAGARRARPAGGRGRQPGRRGVRRRRHEQADQGHHRRGRGDHRHSRAADRPRGPQGGRAQRPGDRGRRRGGPDGRHGLPPAGRVAPAPRRHPAPDAAVLGHPRRRGRRADQAVPARPRVPRGRPRPPSPSTRCSTASCSSTRWTR